MNIHFDDVALFEKLRKATLATIKVGSHMYGTNNENSDTDWLCIYATSENELHSAIQTHHQLQFIHNGVDYNFVSLHNFIRNCVSGDSTINFEVLQSNALSDFGTDLAWLNKYKDSFITYTIIRSYLGFARRDIKHFHRYSDEYNKKKRLRHIVRGYIYARKMIDRHLDFNAANAELRQVELDVSTNIMLRKYEAKISELRNELTEKFNYNTLGYAQHFDVEAGIKLTNELCEFCKSDIFKNKQLFLIDFNLDVFINSFENWVEYEK